MSESTHELARRDDHEHADALSTILGTGDTRSALAQVEKNVRDIIDVCRERGFITQYEQVNKKTGETKISEFYGVPAWQLLGMTYGVTPVVEWVKAIDGGYQARAVAQTRDGSVVGGAEALCHRKEPGKQYKSDHDLAAMAQARAQRNALRSALGAALVLAGFDFPDPEAPATNPQVGILHQLERDLGWTHDEGHTEAGVDSYKDLSREQAAEVIDRWQAIKDARPEPGPRGRAPAGASPSGGAPPGERSEDSPGSSDPSADSGDPDQEPETDGPATAQQWQIAAGHGLKSAAVLRRARELFPDRGITSPAALTKQELAAAIEALL